MTPQEQAGFLQWMCNRYGDFKVARASKDKGWGRHWSVLELWEKDWGVEFLGKVNNRSILKPEICLDLDEDPHTRIFEVLKVLNENRWEYHTYFTGSRGYHIFMIFPKLSLYSRYGREQLRRTLIEELGCDLLKSSEGHMIALEHAPHWKTGRRKLPVTVIPR